MNFFISDNRFKLEILNGGMSKKFVNWYYKLKGVRFNEQVEVFYIPSINEIDNKEELWWSFEDIDNFRKIYYNIINDR